MKELKQSRKTRYTRMVLKDSLLEFRYFPSKGLSFNAKV